MRPTRIALALLSVVALSTRTVEAQVGSGSVSFSFTTFLGPMALANGSNVANAAGWSPFGLINQRYANLNKFYQIDPNLDIWEIRGATTFNPGTTTATLTNVPLGGPTSDNIFSFAARPFTNVTLGQNFILGTFSFTNGTWFGSNTPGPFGEDRITHLGFSITTASQNGSAFNQTINGTINMNVHSIPNRSLCNTTAGQDAEADWLTITGPAVLQPMGAFRVYDSYCLAPGYTNSGSFDLVAQFNSLDLVGFTNPQGGFLTQSIDPLADTPAPITTPEPGTYVLVAGGLAAIAGAARRRRVRDA